MTVAAILRAAPVATTDDHLEPERVTQREMYARDALHPLPGRELRDIPIRVDHQKDAEPIGYVTAMRTDDDVFGGHSTWVFVHAEITDPPGWLCKGTPVSISRSAYDTRVPWGAQWELVQKAIFTEVSILSPGVRPAFPGAAVVWMEKRETPKRAALTATGGEVIPIRRAARRLPATFPRSEFDRRWEFAAQLEDAGIRGVFEAELEHVQRLEKAMQLGRMPESLHQLPALR